MSVPFTSIPMVLRGLHRQLLDKQDTASLGNFNFKDDLAMGYTFELICRNGGFELDGSTIHPEWVADDRTLVHIIITKDHTRGWIAFSGWRDPVLGDISRLESVPLHMFEHLSSHDDCVYPAIGSALFDKYYKMYEDCYKMVPEEHRRKARDACFDIYPDTFVPFITPLEITSELDPNGRNPQYTRKITKLTKVKRMIEL